MMVLTYIVSVIIGSYFAITTAAQCPSGWTQHQSTCYWFSTDKVSWEMAGATCITFSGKLAEPKTQSAADFITGRSHQLHDSFWIGISDLNVEGEWIYPSDHSPVTLNHWAPTEPNSKENENCGLTWYPLNSLWGDYPCASNLKYVCEMPTDIGETVIG